MFSIARELPSNLDRSWPTAGFARIDLGEGAWLGLQRDWLSLADAGDLFTMLRAGVQWELVTLRIMGRLVHQPRLTAWYGDPGLSYRYSGRTFDALPWLDSLLALNERLRRETGQGWNSCLCNLYRDGRDSMGLHADDEPELGPTPAIASISLGATRRIVLRHNTKKKDRRTIDLPHGSLLVMGGTTQLFWKHEIRKTASPVGERINLTFRTIFPRNARRG